jgi:class 3 adenylate cyclase/tetratricopeptide (TPR) repeat protein
MEIAAWLAQQNLSEHTEAFVQNGVDFALLPELTNEDLKDLGIARLADRKRLLRAIEVLREDRADTSAEAVAPMMQASEHRQVTVLFADIAGYTRLSSELGAEQTHGLLEKYFDVVDGVIASFGGTVDKHIGDCVMAVYGAPIAHDRDPLRAVRTALEIHDRLEGLSGELGVEIKSHIGIACGQVVASDTGSDAHRSYTVTGESVNLASRLQEKAAPGDTLISEAVHREVADQVECRSEGLVNVKGIAEPIPAWRVKTLRPTDQHLMRAPFIGRDSEVGQFSGLLHACKALGHGQTVIVRGEAGIGKTRLVEEFTEAARSQGFIAHKGLVLDFGVSTGGGAVRSIVRSLLRIAPGACPAVRRSTAETVLADKRLPFEQRCFLSDLLDLPQCREDQAKFNAMDNAARNEGRRSVVAGLLHGLSEDQPVLVVVEDVHWAEPMLLTHLARMAATVANCRALLVITTRVEGDPLSQTWRSTTGGCPLITIDLGPLRDDDAVKLANMFGDAEDSFARDCVRRAAGNPLFLEQLLRDVNDSIKTELPASIQSLVLARMDRLPASEKVALQAASILGQRFSLEPLRELLQDPQFDCQALIERHLIRPEADEYLFAHALVQQGVYGSLLSARRTELHRAAAAWYRQRDSVLHAEHLDRAGDAGAAAAYLDAVKMQVRALHFEKALSLTNRGIGLAKDADVRFDLMCMRGDALRITGATDASIEAFDEALASATNDARCCRAWIGMAEGMRIADRHAAALDVLAKAQRSATSLGLEADLAHIHYLRGNVFFPLGKIQGCLEEHEISLRLARQVNGTEAEALALGGLGDAHYLNGRMRTAFAQFHDCILICREHGYRRIEVANRHMMGWSRIHLMELSDALEDAHSCIEMAVEVSHRRAELLALMLVGSVETERGNIAEAENVLERAIGLARQLSARNFEAQSLMDFSRLELARGRRAQALELAEHAANRVRDVGMMFLGPSVLACWAMANGVSRASNEALEEAERILDAGCVGHNQSWFARFAIDYAIETGDWDALARYTARLKDFTSAEPLELTDFMVRRGQALAAWGKGQRDDQLMRELTALREEAERTGFRTLLPGIDAALGKA